MVGYSKNVSCEKGRLFKTTKHSRNENVPRVFSSRASTECLERFIWRDNASMKFQAYQYVIVRVEDNFLYQKPRRTVVVNYSF